MKPTIKTFAELHHAMKAFHKEHVVANDIKTKSLTPAPTVKDVLWFVAVTQASEILNDCSTKDLAGILLDGFTPITKKSVETDWLALNIEMIESGDDGGWNFDEMFSSFYGVKK